MPRPDARTAEDPTKQKWEQAMRNGNEWRWCVAGNVKEEKPEKPGGLCRRPLPLKKKVFIAKDYDPASGEVTVARLNINGRSVTIARIPV